MRTLTALQLKNEHYLVQAEVQEGSPLQGVAPFELAELAMEVLFRGVPKEGAG